MSNELLLVLNLVVVYGMALGAYYLFGNKGLNLWTVIATIAANIEVLILINAFGVEQTLGNIMFASTFVVTDILSEVSGKKEANQAVNIGIIASIAFIIITQFWLLYTPSVNDWAFDSIGAVFSNTPRMMIAGVAVYAIVQKFDVWAYHAWWNLTEQWSGNRRSLLWIRNNGSTLISQLLNAILFTVAAFYGTYDSNTLIQIAISSYIIFAITSVLDTPIVYLARKLKEKGKINRLAATQE